MATEKQIAWLKALPRYDELAKEIGEYSDSRDYMGPNGNWKAKFIPRSFYGVDFNVVSWHHDGLYSVGGTAQDRFVADAMFLADFMKHIELCGLGWFKAHFARMRSIKYFEAVRAGGESSFNFKRKRAKR